MTGRPFIQSVRISASIILTAFCCHCAPSPLAFGNRDDESSDRKSGLPPNQGLAPFDDFSVLLRFLYGSAPPVMKFRTRQSSSRPKRRHSDQTAACRLLSALPSEQKKPEPQVSAFEHSESSVTVLPEPVAPISSIWVRASEFVTQSSFICSVRS